MADELPHGSITIPYEALIRKVDLAFYRDRRNELEYQFTKRDFRADPAERGAYGDVVSDYGYGYGGYGTGTYDTPRDAR